MSVHITIVCDNTAAREGLLTEHGFAAWVATPDAQILFDTGSGKTLMANGAALGIDFGRADAIVLSHGHYDHTGGLAAAMQQNRRARIFAHPGVTCRRWSIKPDAVREIGMPADAQVQWAQSGDRCQLSRTPVHVAEAVWFSGAIAARRPEEVSDDVFTLDEAGTRPDPVSDDAALILETPQGCAVVLGCAHAGVVGTVNHAQQVTGRPVHTVIGGTHLRAAGPERLIWTLEALRRRGIRAFYPAHCSGKAADWFRDRWPEATHPCGAGTKIDLE